MNANNLPTPHLRRKPACKETEPSIDDQLIATLAAIGDKRPDIIADRAARRAG